MFPLNDFFNHHNPTKSDRSDTVSFGMQVTEAGIIRYNGKLKINSTICKILKLSQITIICLDTSPVERDVNFPVFNGYNAGDEIKFTYSNDLSPAILL